MVPLMKCEHQIRALEDNLDTFFFCVLRGYISEQPKFIVKEIPNEGKPGSVKKLNETLQRMEWIPHELEEHM